MMNFLKLLMKRPTDTRIRNLKIVLGVLLLAIGFIAFRVQNLQLENSIFGVVLDPQMKNFVSYIIIGIGGIPLLLGGLDINILSRGYTKIMQILFGIILIIISGMFIDTATLSVDIFYFLLGLVVAIIGITGKFITKKGLKHGQKITKIRV
ncbi:hypothetical protein N9J72_03085 [Candidatus Gracilibacteria bacterium]|nr:hypothetical protein [Candidatus Gracilibacteria bacterium]